MRFPFTAYIENLRSHFISLLRCNPKHCKSSSGITHSDPFISLPKEIAIFKFKKGPTRKKVTKQELRTGVTFDSHMLHFLTFAIFVRIRLPALALSWLWLCEICYLDFWDICYSC